ncbi:MAG: glycosyltransferase [Candidatus Paceibacterota bacterium]
MHKKIKVVFIINNFLIGGVERLLFDIISFFDRDKYDIKIITVLGSGPLEASFRELGIPIYFAGTSLPFSQKIPFKLYWLLIAPITLIRITFFLLKSKPDIVVTSLYQADVLGMISSKIVGVKKRILIQHDVVKFGSLVRIVKKIFALNFSTKVIAISGTVKKFLVGYFKIKNEKIAMISNGIDYENFLKGRKTFLNGSIPVIGMVGRLENVKGHIYLLEALKILKEKYNLSPFTLIAGDGSLRIELEKYTTTNHLDSVKFLGNISNVPNFLSQIDILVVPSINEGFGLVVIEGMVSDKLVIASDIKVMQELIKDNETGLLFESQNPESLAEIILRVLRDRELCEKIQKNALLSVEKNKKLFDIREVSKNYQNLFFS